MADGSTGFRPPSRLVDFWLERRAEPFTWALEPPALQNFLAARGFVLEELALTRELSTSRALLDGENLAVAVRA